MIVKVGNDEFCSTCMDWQEYDEEGRCKVCKKTIKKSLSPKEKDSYSSHESESIEIEEDESAETDY